MAGCLKRFFSPELRKIISLAVARTHHQNSAHMLSQQHATRATAKRAASSPRQSRIICSHSDMLRVLYSNLRLLAAVCCSDTSVGASRQPQFHGSTLARSRSGSLAPHETEPCSHAQLTFAHLEKPRTKLRTREWPPWHSGCEPAKPQRTKRRRMRCHALHSAEPQPAESAARRQWARPAVRCSRESPARVPAPPGCSLHRADHRRPLEPPLWTPGERFWHKNHPFATMPFAAFWAPYELLHTRGESSAWPGIKLR